MFPTYEITFIALGTLNTLMYARYFFDIIKKRKEYLRDSKQWHQTILKSGNASTWEFTDTHFHYSNALQDLKVSWALFRAFQLEEGNLFLEVGNKFYILNEEDVGKDEFHKIITLVRSKIRMSLIWL